MKNRIECRKSVLGQKENRHERKTRPIIQEKHCSPYTGCRQPPLSSWGGYGLLFHKILSLMQFHGKISPRLL